ncbi:adenosine receptor A2b isoform X2 [Monomorium pharaonis]|uniref:adenosine receptor A2b isoform X2 n=1 Tax=Monomorium pharaonis TaxID=307658 RepID=UPI00063EE1DD|nr:adenosine receptor A2b isoform X2 [Monomorium pharaonis]
MGFPSSNVTDPPGYDYLNHTGPTNASSFVDAELNLPYTVCEILVAICAVFGNGLVIIVFGKERKLRRRTNYYIVSLATADLLVGLFAIPFAILASIGLPTNLHACLFTVSVLVVLCTISIFCLVAVSVDRYWAILYPMGYSRTVRTKTAIGIICVCWVAGTLVGFLPLLGWNTGEMHDHRCIFTNVMDYNYLVFLYFATIIFPALLIAAFYAHIYRVIVRQQIVTVDSSDSGGGGTVRRLGVLRLGGRLGRGNHHHQSTGTMLRCLGAARKREVKATQNLSRIVVFFIVCWFPLYTINCVMAFCPHCEVDDFFMKFCIILSHINSVGNPLLYAYHLKDFRIALKNFVWRLLFPHSDVKSSVISVIQDRGSLVGSQRLHRRFSGFDQPRSQRPSLLRQVIDVNRRMDGAYPERRVSSIREKETRQNATDVGTADGSAVLIGNSSAPTTTASKRTREEKEVLASDGDVVDRNDDDDANSEDRGISSMELQTYKSLAPLLPAEENRVEETPPASIFVIEADVVNHASPDRLLVLEESRDRIDVAGG